MKQLQVTFYASKFLNIPISEMPIETARELEKRVTQGFKDSHPQVKDFWIQQMVPTVSFFDKGAMWLMTAIFTWTEEDEL